MLTKKNGSFIVTIVLSMVILAYISYVAVYEQILSKSNGFFNVILFGVVLILVFIFITLLARIITFNPDSKDNSPVLRILIIVGILAIFAVFVFSRLQYTSSVSNSESAVYKAAVAISDGTLPQLKDLHDKLVAYPGDFSYSLIISAVFGISESTASVFTFINIIMMLISAAFLFLTVNLISGKTCATVAVIFFMFIPNNSFLVYSYNSELFCTANFLISLFLYELMIYKRFKSNTASVIVSVLCGIFSGLAICAEPVLLLVFIALMIWVLKAERQQKFLCFLPQIISVVFMAIVSAVKSLISGIGIIDIFKGFFLCFVPTSMRDAGSTFSFMEMLDGIKERFNDPSRFMNDNFYFLTKDNGKSFSKNQAVWLDIADQIIYIFMIILCVMCVVYVLRVYYDKIMPLLSSLIAVFICQVLGGANRVGYIYFTALIMIIGSSTLYYMYMNHHNDYAVMIINEEIAKDEAIKLEKLGEESESDEDTGNVDANADGENALDEEYLKRARALIFIGEDDNYYNYIKVQEKQARINNPYAATKIKTTLNEEGVYDSVEENLEFFDELDEKSNDIKQVHEVKAIPSTRPVEVVKPVLADDYYEETANNNNSFADIPVAEPVLNKPSWNEDIPNTDMPLPTNKPKFVDPYVDEDKTVQPTYVNVPKSAPAYDEDKTVVPTYLNAPKSAPAYDEDKTVMPTYVNVPKSAPAYDEDKTVVPTYLNIPKSAPTPTPNTVSAPVSAPAPVSTQIPSPMQSPVSTPVQAQAPVPSSAPLDNGFVFRNKEKAKESTPPVPVDKKTLKAQQKESERQAKLAAKEADKQAKLAAKEAKKAKKATKGGVKLEEMPNSVVNPMDVEPGQPLPNPLPLPKAHVAKSLDYDFDYKSSGKDDYDYNVSGSDDYDY